MYAPTVGSQQAAGFLQFILRRPRHIAPLSQYMTDVANNTLPRLCVH